jgi:UDP-sugar transporter A1/2/3
MAFRRIDLRTTASDVGDAMALDWKAWAALTVFVFQNAAMALLMRWNKSVAPPYSNSVAVLMQEFAVKLPLSFLLYAYDVGGAPLEAMREDLRLRSDEWLKLSIPALLYTVQNIMLYVGYANLEAAVGMVTYQTKVLFTAFCSVLLLGKKLNVNQWSAVAILAVGIVCVQGIFDAKPPKPRVRSHRHHKHTGVRMLSEMDGASLFELVDGRALGESSEGNVTLGITAMLIASACTSFASVYFEKMLKSDSKPNLWPDLT